MSQDMITEGDNTEVTPAETDALEQETTEEHEESQITVEGGQDLPQINVEEAVDEPPAVDEIIQETVAVETVDVPSPELVETSVNETIQDPVQYTLTESAPEPVQPSVDESAQEAVTKEGELGDVHTSAEPEEQKTENAEQPDTSLEAGEVTRKLEPVGEGFEFERVSSLHSGVKFERENEEGISNEEKAPVEEEEEKLEVEAGNSIIDDIELIPTETSPPHKEDTEIEHIETEAEVSAVSLHANELPEIRGLADLEDHLEHKDSKEGSIIKEDWIDDFSTSRRKSTRPSYALKKLMELEDEEEPTMKSKGRSSKGDDFKLMTDNLGDGKDQPTMDREEYYNLYEKVMNELPSLKMKNKFLQRKMGELFKKRKMEHALKEESDIGVDAVDKYKNQLNKLAHLLKVYRTETLRINEELELLEEEKEVKSTDRQDLFVKLINREKEIGFGLISTKTGKEIPSKVVEQLIRRQINSTKEKSELRLKYITKRDELAEKTAELKSLDNIGEDLSLMDYEQLKIENRSLADKLEEKDEELSKLRVKCRNAVQVMAHIREKAAALDADMDILKEDFEEVNYGYIEMRERLNFFKTERDEVRIKTMKLKADSGLLTKPKLLMDMEASMEEAKQLEETLEKVKNDYISKTHQIRILRKNIAYEMMMNRKPQKKKKKDAPKFYNARPTLVQPRLASNVVDKLERIMKEKGERQEKKS